MLTRLCPPFISEKFERNSLVPKKIVDRVKYRVRHQNPDKSNNFSKQNFINEKIEYYKKFFYISHSESLQIYNYSI